MNLECISIKFQIFFLLFSLIPLELISQSVDDSIEEAIIEIEEAPNYEQKKKLLAHQIDRVKFKYRDHTIRLCEIAIESARTARDTSFLLTTLQIKAVQHINFHNFDNASSALKEIEGLALKTLDTLNLTLFYIHKGYLKKRSNQYSEAIFYYEKGRNLAFQSKDHRRYANATNRLGLLMSSIGEHKKACDYYRQVVNEEHNYFRTTALMNLMETFVIIGQIDSTKKYLKVAEAIVSTSSIAKVEIYRTKSILAQDEGNIDQAILYMQQALEYSFVHDYILEQLMTLISLYDLYKTYKNEYKVEYLDRAKQIAESVNDMEALKKVLAEYAEFYEHNKQYDKSVNAYKRYLDIDLIHEDILMKDISEMDKNIYRLFKKENENTQLFLDNQKKQVRLDKRKRQRNFWLLISILMAVATIITYRLLKQKQYFLKSIQEKQEMIERAVEEKQMLLQEMNHRIKNNYNIIGDMLKHSHSQDDIDYVRTKLNAMAVIHAILLEYSEAQTSISSIDFLPKFLRHIKKSYFSGGEVDISPKIDQHEIFTKHAVLMGIVINEIFTNIWKHEDLSIPLDIDFSYVKKDLYEIVISWKSSKMKQSDIPSHGQGQRILKNLLVQNGGELNAVYGQNCRVVIRI